MLRKGISFNITLYLLKYGVQFVLAHGLIRGCSNGGPRDHSLWPKDDSLAFIIHISILLKLNVCVCVCVSVRG